MTLVANTTAGMIWEYENFQFNSFCDIGGVIYGANENGIFVIDSGDLDDTTPITSEWSFGSLKLAESQSRVPYAYVRARGDGDLNVSLATDDGDPITYTVTPRLEDQSHAYRVVTAKGARGQYWKLAVTNVDGCDFRVDSIDLDVAPSARRV